MRNGNLLVQGVHSLVTGDGPATGDKNKTSDENTRVLHDLDLLCRNGVIEYLGPQMEERPNDVDVIDGKDLIVYPGLINTHHHFFQALVRNQINLDWSRLSLVEWLDRIYQVFTLINEDCIYHASLVSLAELAKSGCTTAFDHQYCFNRHAGSRLVDRQFEAASKIGMRLVVGRGTNTLPRDKGSTIPDEMLETTSTFIIDCERIFDAFHEPAPFSMHSLVIAPCQPVNCYEETFLDSIALARDKNLRFHTHLCEGENALMSKRWGQRSLDWCIERDIVGADVWFAHCWEMSESELKLMGETNTGLSHCPAAMCLVGDGLTDLAAASHYDVPIGLGVDGQASNDNSNLLECIRLAYLLQCLGARGFNYPLPSPYSFLDFATRGGATLLGRPELGHITVGGAADFFAVNRKRVEFAATLHDPALLPIKVGINGPVDLTVVAGNVVWREG
ncbi:MAG: amidohydrolase family protein, partial [Pseudomonadota bacterium]